MTDKYNFEWESLHESVESFLDTLVQRRTLNSVKLMYIDPC